MKTHNLIWGEWGTTGVLALLSAVGTLSQYRRFPADQPHSAEVYDGLVRGAC